MSLIQPTKSIVLACVPDACRRRNYILACLQLFGLNLALLMAVCVAGFSISKDVALAVAIPCVILFFAWVWTGLKTTWARISNIRGTTKNSWFFVVAFFVLAMIPVLNVLGIFVTIALWCLDSHDNYPKEQAVCE